MHRRRDEWPDVLQSESKNSGVFHGRCALLYSGEYVRAVVQRIASLPEDASFQ